MKVKDVINWLGTLDPEIDVVLEGLTYSSNVDSQTGNFYVYHESVDFDAKYSSLECGKLYIGLDV